MELDFNKNMILAIEVVNESLSSFGAAGLFENSDIEINKDVLLDNYIQFKFQRHNKHVPLYFEISGAEGIRVDIDRARETFEWTVEEMGRERHEVLIHLNELFTSYFLVEYHGANRTMISLFDENGRCIDTYKYQNGITLKGKRQDKLYFPVFQKCLLS